MTTTATAEKAPKKDAQRFLQSDIPKLINAFQKGGFEGAYAAFPHFEQRIVRGKLIKLEVAESSRPQIKEEHKESIGQFKDKVIGMLAEEFGSEGKIGSSYVRALISSLRDELPKAAPKAADEAPAA